MNGLPQMIATKPLSAAKAEAVKPLPAEADASAFGLLVQVPLEAAAEPRPAQGGVPALQAQPVLTEGRPALLTGTALPVAVSEEAKTALVPTPPPAPSAPPGRSGAGNVIKPAILPAEEALQPSRQLTEKASGQQPLAAQAGLASAPKVSTPLVNEQIASTPDTAQPARKERAAGVAHEIFKPEATLSSGTLRDPALRAAPPAAPGLEAQTGAVGTALSSETGASPLLTETARSTAPQASAAPALQQPLHEASRSEPPALTQVRAAIEARDGAARIELRLDPPELGRVQIEFEMRGNGQLRAVISANEADTLELMRQHGGSLEDELRDQGFGDLSFEWRSGQDEKPHQSASEGLCGQPAPLSPPPAPREGNLSAATGLDLKL
jgi:flagellar hook-length control protein FliK